MPDHSESRMTLWLSADLKQRLQDELTVDDSYSGWTREAVQLRFAIEAECDRRGVELPAEYDAFEDLVVDLVRAGVDARDDSA